MEDKKWFATFGAPGTGKTTILKKMVLEFPKYNYISNDSIVTDGSPLHYYHKKMFMDGDFSYSFKFQMEVLPLRFRQCYGCSSNSFVDETIYDAYTYTKALLKLNWITEQEYHTFMSNYKLLDQLIEKPTTIVYLKCTDIFFILSRLAMRGRSIEKKFSIEYIEALLDSFDEVAHELKESHYNIVELDTLHYTGEGLYETIVERLKLKDSLIIT